MSEAGYSGTPLMKKLGAKPRLAALYVSVPDTITAMQAYEDWGRLVSNADMVDPIEGLFDFIHIFETDLDRLKAALPVLREHLSQTGMVWISWPKKASKVPTTLDGGVVRSAGIAAGLVDIKVCAVDAVWSGHKFVIPVKDRR